MTKQIRFMSTTTNQTVAQGDHVRLNCFAQYYSEKVDGKLYKVVYYVFSLYAHRQWTRRIFRRFSGFSNDDKYRTAVNYSSNLFFICIFVSRVAEKYTLGTDSLVIRNFSYYDQGVYYCRAFITLRNNFLSKLYPIYVQLQSKSSLTLTFHSKIQSVPPSQRFVIIIRRRDISVQS